MRELLEVINQNTKINIKVFNKTAFLESVKEMLGNLLCTLTNFFVVSYAVKVGLEDPNGVLVQALLVAGFLFMVPSLIGIYKLFKITLGCLTKSVDYYREITLLFEKSNITAIEKKIGNSGEINYSREKFSELEDISKYFEMPVKQVCSILETELLRIKHEKEDSELRLSKLAFQLKD